LRDEKEEGRSESALDDAPAVVGLAGQAAVAQDEAEAALVVRAVSIGICRMGLVERIAAASRPNVILVEHLGCLCISRGNAQSALGAGELGLEFALTQAVLGLLLTAKLLERIERLLGAHADFGFTQGSTDGRVAFVTGAAHGQGRAIAIALATAGADIVALDVAAKIEYPGYAQGSVDELDSLVSEVEALGRAAIAAVGDVRDAAAVQSAVDAAVARFGRIDILVNNAGIVAYSSLEDMSEAE